MLQIFRMVFLINVVYFICLSTANAEALTFGSMANDLTIGVGVFTKIIHLVCFIMSLVFVVMAASLFRAHRTNPKYVPLDRPILYVVIAFILFGIPFLGSYFVKSGSLSYEQGPIKDQAQVVQVQDIDAPLNWGNDYNH